MTHITPKQREELPELEPMLQMVEASMGFLPTSMMTMAHWPELTQAFGGLGATILHSGELDRWAKANDCVRGEQRSGLPLLPSAYG